MTMDPSTPETTPFALRMPSELKEAVTALSKCNAVGSQQVDVSSINKAVLYTMRRGLQNIVEELKPGAENLKEDRQGWETVVGLFAKDGRIITEDLGRRFIRS